MVQGTDLQCLTKGFGLASGTSDREPFASEQNVNQAELEAGMQVDEEHDNVPANGRKRNSARRQRRCVRPLGSAGAGTSPARLRAAASAGDNDL
jgi:hypothetical protein